MLVKGDSEVEVLGNLGMVVFLERKVGCFLLKYKYQWGRMLGNEVRLVFMGQVVENFVCFLFGRYLLDSL